MKPGQQFFGIEFDYLPTFIRDFGVTSQLASTTDRNGNTLTFTGMGIQSDSGRDVQENTL